MKSFKKLNEEISFIEEISVIFCKDKFDKNQSINLKNFISLKT